MPPDGRVTPDMPDRQPTVLVVDDYEMLRMTVSAQLEFLGFNVLTAATADEARAAFAAQPEIALLWADQNLAGTETGAELAQSLTARYPQLKVLICSGDFEPQSSWPAEWIFLRKPAKRADIAKALGPLVP